MRRKRRGAERFAWLGRREFGGGASDPRIASQRHAGQRRRRAGPRGARARRCSLSKPDVLALIPARGGSKSVPRKNLLPVAGRPLIAYSIMHAQACPLITRVI